jgi:hypothetical protein
MTGSQWVVQADATLVSAAMASTGCPRHIVSMFIALGVKSAENGHKRTVGLAQREPIK